MNLGRPALLVGGLLWATMIEASAQKRVVVEDAVTCRSCEIEFVRTATIGGDEDPFGVVALDASRAAFHDSGEFWIASSQSRGTLVRFGATGEVLEVVDREGDGPGEFRQIHHIFFVGDTLVVLHSGRISLLSPAGELIATHPMGVMAHRAVWSGRGILANALDESMQSTVKILSLDGTVSRSFSAPTRGVDPGAAYRVRVAASYDGAFWTASENVYRATRWDSAGVATLVLERNAPWFSDWRLEDWSEPRDDPLPPRLMYMYEADDVLWTVTLVADREFRPFPDPGNMYRVRPSEHPQLDAVVEAIDIDDGVVLARRRFPGMISEFREGGMVAMFEATPIGAQIIHFGRLRLVGR